MIIKVVEYAQERSVFGMKGTIFAGEATEYNGDWEQRQTVISMFGKIELHGDVVNVLHIDLSKHPVGTDWREGVRSIGGVCLS